MLPIARGSRRTLARLGGAVLLMLGLVAGPAGAVAGAEPTIPFTYSVDFEAPAQGLPAISDRTADIIPKQTWNESGSGGDIEDVCDPTGITDICTYWGAELDASTSGELSFGIQLQNAGGTVSVTYPYQVVFKAAPPQGQEITIYTEWVTDPSAAVITTTPTDGTVGIAGSFGLSAGVSGEVCVGGCLDGDIVSATIPTQSGTIVSVSENLKAPIIGIPGVSGSLGAPNILKVDGSPTVSGDAVTATGATQFGTFELNLAQWANMALGNPVPLAATAQFNGTGVSYTLVSLGTSNDFTERHWFTFDPRDVQVTLQLPESVTYHVNSGAAATGDSITFTAGDTLYITIPQDTHLDITPGFAMNHDWNYQSDVEAVNHGNFEALAVSASIAGEGIDIGPLVDWDLGEIIDGTIPQVNLSGQLSGNDTGTWSPFTVYATKTRASLAGTMGDNDWYTTDVDMTLTGEAMFGIASTHYSISSGSFSTYSSPVPYDDGEYVVEFYSVDGAGVEEDPHGSISFKVDTTDPTVTYTGNAGAYTVDQQVHITCSTDDNLSGVASDTCADVTGHAYSFPLGPNTFSATAVDNAGNDGYGETTFTVSVDPDSLCSLTGQFIDQKGVVKALCAILDAAKAAEERGDQEARAGQVQAYINAVAAQRDKLLTSEQTEVLIELAQAL